MPYITQDKRKMLDSYIEMLHRKLVEMEMDDEKNNMEGNVNYIFTKLIRMVYGRTPSSYSDINDVMGLVFGVALEHYITVARPYEMQKEYDNGDVEANVQPIAVEEIVVKQNETN